MIPTSFKPFISPAGLSRSWYLLTSVCLGLIAWMLFLGITRLAQADVGPVAVDEHGYTLAPAEATPIQMISETVLIEVAYPITLTYDAYVRDAAQVTEQVEGSVGAMVTADFLFRNLEAETHRLTVGFPVTLPSSTDLQRHLYFNFYPVQGLRAFVNGRELVTRQATVDGSAWRVWGMDFPPGDTRVRVTYLMSTIEELGYVLHTGAPWAGPIGQVDLIVRFPCPAQEVLLGPDPVTGYTVEGRDLRWHYENLEPTQADDLAFHFSAAECWSRQATRQAGPKPTLWPTDTPRSTPLVSVPTPSMVATPTPGPTDTPYSTELAFVPTLQPPAASRATLGVELAATAVSPPISPPSATPMTGCVWGGAAFALLVSASIYLGQRRHL